VDGILWYRFNIEEGRKEFLEDIIRRLGKWSIPFFPGGVWVVVGEIVHYVGGKEMGYFLDEAH